MVDATLTVTGTYNVTGATEVNAGTVNFAVVPTSLGATFTITNGGKANLNVAITLPTSTTVVFISGVLGGTGTLTVNGLLDWNPGSVNTANMSGTGATIANGGISLRGPGIKALNRSLTNTGVATWSSGNITTSGSGVFNNEPGADFVVTLTASNDLTGTFNNLGDLSKTGSGSNTISTTFNNSGIVNAQAGTLSFTNSYIQIAGALILNGGSVGGTITKNIQGGVVSGSGSIAGNVSVSVTSGSGSTDAAITKSSRMLRYRI